METEAAEFFNKKQWALAAELYTKLLFGPCPEKNQTIGYLLARSECFRELGQHEGVVGDCRAAIRLLEGSDNEVMEYKFRRRLVYALFSLKRFGEAELIVKEWVAKSTSVGKTKEALKFMEDLYGKFYPQNQNRSPQMIRPQSQNGAQTPTCIYCNASFGNQVELRAHCQTQAHQMAVMSDEGRDWRFRPPPRGYTSEGYTLCENFTTKGICRYGSQCTEAHGLAELNEWKERFQYRVMKMQKAYEKELYGKSYTEILLDQFSQAANPESIMKERLDYIQCSISSDLMITISSKNTSRDWEFTIKSGLKLLAVALLQDTYRNHFEISSITCRDLVLQQSEIASIDNNQEWLKERNFDRVLSRKEYKVRINFKTEIFGTFRQSVVFDFGLRPLLVRHFCVDVLPISDLEKINDIKKEIILSNSGRWDHSNCTIIPFNTASVDPDSSWFETLQRTYPSPNPSNFVLSQSTLTEKLFTKHNYKSRMHELLYIEEMARNEQISMYNLSTVLTIAQSYLLTFPNSSTTAKYALNGELFALVKVGRDLSEDTAHGRLILSNCITVLLSEDIETPRRKAYECPIEDKGKNVIYLRIPTRAVSDLNLHIDTQFAAQIQFQLNRIPYCEWHYAVDKLNDFKLIYPDVFVQPDIPWSPLLQWNDSMDTRLNVKQREAIIAISTPLYVKLPPILILGPFGTGKTFTLAQAIKHLLATPTNRILVCTHSNSAADLYIKEYLDPYIKLGHPEATPLRIYYQKRWVTTVNETVQKYCLIDTEETYSFRLPTIKEIEDRRIVVVTLSISMYLTRIGLPRGFFTHILLDEAAQAIESESIMPLALADENTRIILAGDHMQLSPEVYSKIAKDRKLHISLLERLYDHYPSNFPCKILLSENYRAHKAIIDFTSESFYDQRLVACGKQPSHENYYPLTFYTTRGEDFQDQNSTAFYNNSEVYELVERVTELKTVWPESWGKFDEHSIGIMSPYADQVFRIRTELRKRKMHGISVERVLNVQGKQFRAVFLSTVRTRRTCQQKNSDELEYGFLSNSKLLNTAVTRAQSLVAVVGDPISLCTIGRCSKVWERFLDICRSNDSLFGISWEQLRSQLDGVELKKHYGLNPLAPEFIPRRFLMETFIINSKIAPRFEFNSNIHPSEGPRLIKQTVPVVMWPPHVIDVPVFNTRPYMIGPSYIPGFTVQPKPNLVPNYIIRNHFSPNIKTPPPITPNQPISENNRLVQFMSNVNFPESIQASCLNECINLLPPNTTLGEMITQSYQMQEGWFFHLLRSKGFEAARKFECLIYLATRRAPPVHPNPNVVTSKNQDNLYNQVDGNELGFSQSNPMPLYERQRNLGQQSIPKPFPGTPDGLNASFSNLSVGGNSNQQRTYASVLKTAKPNGPSEMPNNLKPEGTSNGPRPYQYFV